jgi:hypothetical protein
VDSNKIREVYRHGGIDDGWEDEKYYKPSRSNWRGRKKRACKKSKTGEKCDFSGTTVKGTVAAYDWKGNRIGNKPRVIKCCIRCGKEDWGYYSWY